VEDLVIIMRIPHVRHRAQRLALVVMVMEVLHANHVGREIPLTPLAIQDQRPFLHVVWELEIHKSLLK
jgi:hypothetical protein